MAHPASHDQPQPLSDSLTARPGFPHLRHAAQLMDGYG